MKVTVAAIGKFKKSPAEAIFTSYIKRIPWKIELKELEALVDKALTDQSKTKQSAKKSARKRAQKK